ncbi:2,3-diphosphoglycerate-dependent phosphoglycerate mutase [Metabacillus sp. GX 13764]|uniref:2,3-diphosphoglycerate-dependent phosphoglycerate mutase n=1 Tax=Metabacillus kandeliae TaxID=2900151 RepID=UPI001E5A073E|nr:2,3-diphosphoglycerate-dependent phosphoglycerate mutase [Metabacillus kandeliae]MCD7033606.1 2,3-diphosphoglycerate-dependent phosphoglycerate mutase [Metabacillus kandeliae]
MYKLVLVRHGQSVWNLENKFTGWTDVDLTPHGLDEAREAGLILKSHGYVFDLGYTSLLKRAIRTLWIILQELDLVWIPISKSWRLNERHYGALQGLDKKETAAKYGEDKVHAWRRSMFEVPPPLDITDSRYPGFEAKYRHVPVQHLPLAENLAATEARVLEYWHNTLAPEIKAGKKIIISAHGNTIRSLVQYLDNLSPDGIADLNIPTGVPLVYELNEQLKPLRSYYLKKKETELPAAGN